MGKEKKLYRYIYPRRKLLLMPRGQLTKNDMLSKVYRLKEQLNREFINYECNDTKALTNKYLNAVLDCLNEYRY